MLRLQNKRPGRGFLSWASETAATGCASVEYGQEEVAPRNEVPRGAIEQGDPGGGSDCLQGSSFLFDQDLLWPIAGAIIVGAVIGLEREYRSSPAGFRTHILVCLSSALLMLAAVHQVRWLTDTPEEIIRIDPVRMAHGVLTGIGFLCGGVIFREGFTVRGLTTAASLWSTAALGVLFGVGFHGLAILGGLATVLVLAAVNLTEAILPQRQHADVTVCYQRESNMDLAGLRKLLQDHGLHPKTIRQGLGPDGLTFGAVVGGYTEERATTLAATLRGTPAVRLYECTPRQV